MDYYNNQDELYHYGRKGMKWGQNIFGKVKSGASRVGKKISDAHQKKKADKAADRLRKKPYSKLTDAELKARIQRMQLEKNLKDLERQVDPTKEKGSKFLSSVTEAAGQAFVNAGRESLTNLIKKRLNKALGLTDELDDLKDEFNKLDYTKKIKDLKDDLDGKNDAAKAKKKQAEDADLDARIYKGKTAKAAYEKNYGESDSKPKDEKSSSKPESTSTSSSDDGWKPLEEVKNTRATKTGFDLLESMIEDDLKGR